MISQLIPPLLLIFLKVLLGGVVAAYASVILGAFRIWQTKIEENEPGYHQWMRLASMVLLAYFTGSLIIAAIDFYITAAPLL